jgi:hypothetical protein
MNVQICSQFATLRQEHLAFILQSNLAPIKFKDNCRENVLCARLCSGDDLILGM